MSTHTPDESIRPSLKTCFGHLTKSGPTAVFCGTIGTGSFLVSVVN
jgi:hypothetical protein